MYVQDKESLTGMLMAKVSKNKEAIRDGKESSNVSKVRSFVVLCSYYKSFIKTFAGTVKPLNKFTKNDQKIWTKKCQESFDAFKSKHTKNPYQSIQISVSCFIHS